MGIRPDGNQLQFAENFEEAVRLAQQLKLETR
jgi:hypothetical protein